MALQVRSIKIDPKIWDALADIARDQHRSTNEYVTSLLKREVLEEKAVDNMLRSLKS